MKRIFLGILVATIGISIFLFSVSLNKYPDLDSCFKTSVSKKLLCSKNKNYVRLGGVSKHFLNAVVMSEDDSFYAHEGLDWKEFRRSMATNLRQFAFVRGGSTITQQLVKNVYLSQKKTITRKIIEAKLAKKIEKEHSKKMILEKYVNAIEFGKDIWGVKQAAAFYFDKSPSALNPLESLYLVILLPSPVKYSKTFFKKELSPYQYKRMGTLLKRMKRRGFVSTEEYAVSKNELTRFFQSPVETLEEIKEEWANSDEEVEVELPEDGELVETEIISEPDVESEEKDVTVQPKYEDIGGAELREEQYSEESETVEDIDIDIDLDPTEADQP